ncbi:hypothetical protein [Methylobacterium sp. WL120]|uniref:hypothetical protein n=1 Tax=Methylobacterium sp. WL120 TaxID=2603887 RepID=UPI0011CB830A|nr:hypothetical protein [Methylobacterium sp. WL120]TXM69640.1 hypothetical protein FV229_04665 [Methylobacterium sp. WL120]
MSKLPATVTYIYGLDHGVERSMCIEASAVVRLASFVRRCGSVQTVRRPLGLDHRNRYLSADALTVLNRQLYRHRVRNDSNEELSVASTYNGGYEAEIEGKREFDECQFHPVTQQRGIYPAMSSLPG